MNWKDNSGNGNDLVKSAEQRIAELEAHVERLRESLEFIRFKSGTWDQTLKACEVLNETPAQSLGMIKEQAIEEAVSACKFNVSDDGNMHFEAVSIPRLLDYAKQLRGEK